MQFLIFKRPVSIVRLLK